MGDDDENEDAKATLHCKCLQGVYGVFVGKSECGDFKIMGIACIPAIPVILKSPHSDFYCKNCRELLVQGFYGDPLINSREITYFPVEFTCILLIFTLFFPVKFDFIFPYNSGMYLRVPVIPVRFTCILQGTFWDTGIPHNFYGEKTCSVHSVEANVPKSKAKLSMKW